jgi:hypothetical protein
LLRRQDNWRRGWLHYQRFWRWGKWSSGRGLKMNVFVLIISQKSFFKNPNIYRKNSKTWKKIL